MNKKTLSIGVFIVIILLSFIKVDSVMADQLRIYSKQMYHDSFNILSQIEDSSLMDSGYVKIDVMTTFMVYPDGYYQHTIDSLEIFEGEVDTFYVNMLVFVKQETKQDTIAFGFNKYRNHSKEINGKKYSSCYIELDYNILYYNGKFYKINWDLFEIFVHCIPHDHKVLMDGPFPIKGYVGY